MDFAAIFSPYLCGGGKCPENLPGKSSAKSSNNYGTKSTTRFWQFSADWQIQKGQGEEDLGGSSPFDLSERRECKRARREGKQTEDSSEKFKRLVVVMLLLASGKNGCTEVRVAECGEQFGRDPSKSGSSESLVLKGFLWGGNTSGLIPASLPHTLGYACTFTSPLSLPQF